MGLTLTDLIGMPASDDPVIGGLFRKAAAGHWDVESDLDWDLEIAADDPLVDPTWTPYGRTPTFGTLAPEVQNLIARRTFIQVLQVLLAGEAVGVHGAAKLAVLCDRRDFRHHASAQALDEARHHQSVVRLVQRLEEPDEPMPPESAAFFDEILQAEDVTAIVVGGPLLAETLALGLTESIAAATTHELIRAMMGWFHRDEARHVAFGVRYVDHYLLHADDEARYGFAKRTLPALIREAERRLRSRDDELRRLAGYLRAANVDKPWALAYRMRAERRALDEERRREVTQGRGVPRCLLAVKNTGLLKRPILEELGLDRHPLIEATLQARPLEIGA